MFRNLNLVPERLRKAIDKILRVGGQTEIVAEVDDGSLVGFRKRMHKTL